MKGQNYITIIYFVRILIDDGDRMMKRYQKITVNEDDYGLSLFSFI